MLQEIMRLLQQQAMTVLEQYFLDEPNMNRRMNYPVGGLDSSLFGLFDITPRQINAGLGGVPQRDLGLSAPAREPSTQGQIPYRDLSIPDRPFTSVPYAQPSFPQRDTFSIPQRPTSSVVAQPVANTTPVRDAVIERLFCNRQAGGIFPLLGF